MVRSFTLVRIECPFQERPLTVIPLHLTEFGDRMDERFAAGEFCETAADFVRNPHGSGFHLVQSVAHPNESVDSGNRTVLDDSGGITVTGKRPPYPNRHFVWNDKFRLKRITAHEHFSARRTSHPTAFPRGRFNGTFDVLARSKSTLYEVRAVARIDRLVQRPYLHTILRRASVSRRMRHLVCAKAVGSVNRFHLHRFGIGTLATFRPFLLVRRPPTLKLHLRVLFHSSFPPKLACILRRLPISVDPNFNLLESVPANGSIQGVPRMTLSHRQGQAPHGQYPRPCSRA